VSSDEYFIDKNGWGAGCGESGHFGIAYSEEADVDQSGYCTISYDAYAPLPPPPPATLIPKAQQAWFFRAAVEHALLVWPPEATVHGRQKATPHRFKLHPVPMVPAAVILFIRFNVPQPYPKH
jgi:hypothetical protein